MATEVGGVPGTDPGLSAANAAVYAAE